MRWRAFQSTLPMRGATCKVLDRDVFIFEFQSTLPMRGATRERCKNTGRTTISIHTPHAGSDFATRATGVHVKQFQSTLPMRGATISRAQGGKGIEISIHTPHAGSDPLYAAHLRG